LKVLEMYQIELTLEAIEDLRFLPRKPDRKRVMDEIAVQLQHEPGKETRNRKRLRPNGLAEWELRVDRFRVFYDVDVEARRVKIVAVGLKRRNRLSIRGKEFKI